DVQPPPPGLLGVEPPQRSRAARPGRLVEPDVALQGECQVAAEGRVPLLVRHQLALGGEGQPLEVVPTPDPVQPLTPEGVGTQDLVEPGGQLSQLEAAELVGARDRPVHVGPAPEAVAELRWLWANSLRDVSGRTR